MSKKKKYQFIINMYLPDNQKACLIHHKLIKYVEKKYSRRVTINKIYKITNIEKTNINFKYQIIVSIHSTDDYKAEIIYNQLKDYFFRTYIKSIRINKLYKMFDVKKEREIKEKKNAELEAIEIKKEEMLLKLFTKEVKNNNKEKIFIKVKKSNQKEKPKLILNLEKPVYKKHMNED